MKYEDGRGLGRILDKERERPGQERSRRRVELKAVTEEAAATARALGTVLHMARYNPDIRRWS
jgi:hypothetical protein